MKALIKTTLYTAIFLISKEIIAQPRDTINLTTTQVEEIFIRQNLLLIAEKFQIDIADAAIKQAKLWTNPTFTVENVNLWSSDDLRDEMAGIFPDKSPIPNRQFAVGIEQIILTGGKRRKLVEMEKVSRDIAEQYFEELLRSLKVELRNICAEILYLQEYKKILEKQQKLLNVLISNYRNQSLQGNVSRSELLRLQATLLQIRSELNELQKDMNQQQKELKTLLNISTQSHIVLIATEINTKSPDELQYSKMIELAETSRPDLKEAMFQKEFFEKSLRYEKAQRKPDIALSAVYDRASGITSNYVGFGISFDLPFFDRNHGNIKATQISISQSQTFIELKQLEIHNEVNQALQNYKLAFDFNRQISDEFIADLDEMQESYNRNFINRNIGIIEFIDFFEAYIENKRTVLSAKKELKICFEELKYAVGTEI